MQHRKHGLLTYGQLQRALEQDVHLRAMPDAVPLHDAACQRNVVLMLKWSVPAPTKPSIANVVVLMTSSKTRTIRAVCNAQ
jgi:hypothetical protein